MEERRTFAIQDLLESIDDSLKELVKIQRQPLENPEWLIEKNKGLSRISEELQSLAAGLQQKALLAEKELDESMKEVDEAREELKARILGPQ